MSKSGCPNVLVPTRTQIFPPYAYQPSVSGDGPARFQQLAFLPKIRDDLKPYPQLETSVGARRERNDKRLLDVANEARSLMDRHGLEDWTFRFSTAKTRLGECRESEKVIQLSARHAVTAERGGVTDTILHEIAHALAGANARHGPAWKVIATRLGARPRARAEESADARRRAQEAKAKFRRGMAVSFRAKRGQRQSGIIEKLNPKRARVNCDGGPRRRSGAHKRCANLPMTPEC